MGSGFAEPYFELICVKNNLFDSPSNGSKLHYLVITDNSTASKVLHDNNTGHIVGWDPDNDDFRFSITDHSINPNRSIVIAHTNDNVNFSSCTVDWLHDTNSTITEKTKLDNIVNKLS